VQGSASFSLPGPGKPTRNVNLTEELDRFVLAKVESGRYENASEVVRAAFRHVVFYRQAAGGILISRILHRRMLLQRQSIGGQDEGP